MDNIQDLFFGKMSQEHSVQTTEKTSVKSCNRFSTSQKTTTLQFLNLKHGTMPGQSWETIVPSHGDFLTLNFGESPKDAEESFLWQILQGGADLTPYYLSQTACMGILERCRKRGKKLPKALEKALKAQINRYS